MTQSAPHPPRVFISYSWTSDEHTEWVADLGERLMADGIDVVLDQWSLQDGQDLNSFMEQMVTEPTIKRVIIVCDAAYATKADARKGGVGTESQIISQEVYEKVDQQKFIPLLREKYADGKPCLPVFLKSRKFIDASDADKEAEAYDQLVRNIHERPVKRKPVLGKAPSHIFDDDSVVVSAASKAKRFLDFVTTGKGNPSAAFEDFAGELVANFEDLRLIYSREQEGSWCETMSANIEKARTHRNLFVDVVRTGAMHVQDGWFMDSLHSLLERILPFQFRPNEVGSFFKCSEDNYKFLLYELFLYTVAALVKSRRYNDARRLFDLQYVAPETLNGHTLVSFNFAMFNDYPESLEGKCAERGNSRRLSVMADLLHDRADRKDIRLGDLVQADIICCIVSSRTGGYCAWHPRSLVYAGNLGHLELFARATNEEGFQPLKSLLHFASPRELIQHICSQSMMRVWHGDRFLSIRGLAIETLFNLPQLKRAWSIEQ